MPGFGLGYGLTCLVWYEQQELPWLTADHVSCHCKAVFIGFKQTVMLLSAFKHSSTAMSASVTAEMNAGCWCCVTFARLQATPTVDWVALASILVEKASSQDEFTRITAIKWIKVGLG